MKNKWIKILIPMLFTLSLSACLRGGNSAISSSDENYSSVNVSSKPTPSSKGTDENCKHKWLLDTDQSYEATCMEPGCQVKICQYCGLETSTKIEPLGHDYQDAPYISGYWEATCTEEGRRAVRCTRCSDEQVEIIPAGHQYEPCEFYDYDGSAHVCPFFCSRCGITDRYGFLASDITYESREYAVIDGDGGTRVWGRPIGNAIELDEDGNMIGDDVENIFDISIKGDYLEYSFNLTYEQAEQLKNCRIACNALANENLYVNGLDFFKTDSYHPEEPTGCYIDGERLGDDVKDFRYLLYVDGVLQEMDFGIDNPVHSSTYRAEYIIPLTFNFHAGLNKIKLVYARGYKSIFYNFTFITENGMNEHSHEWIARSSNNAEGKTPYTIEKCGCEKERINFEAVDLDGTITYRGGNISRNGTTARYLFDACEEKTAKLCIYASVGQVMHLQYGFFNGKNGGSSIVTLPDGRANTTFLFNGEEVSIPMNSTYGELGITGPGEAGAAIIELGSVNISSGTNELKVTRNDSYSLYYYNFYLVYEGEMNHNIQTGEKAENSALRTCGCACGNSNGYELRAEDLTEGQKSPNPSDKSTRLGKNNIMDDVWDITGIEEGTYALYLEARCSTGCSIRGYWDSNTAVMYGDTESNNGGTELSKEYKYKIKIDDENYINVGNSEDNYANTGIDDVSINWTNKSMAEISIRDDAKTITLHNMNNGYAIWVFGIRLIRL